MRPQTVAGAEAGADREKRLTSHHPNSTMAWPGANGGRSRWRYCKEKGSRHAVRRGSLDSGGTSLRGARSRPAPEPPYLPASCERAWACLRLRRRLRPASFLTAARARPRRPFGCSTASAAVRDARVRIELAADELNLSDFGRVAATVAQLQHPGVATQALGKARSQRVEQLRDDLAVGHVARDDALGRHATDPLLFVGALAPRGCALRSR